MDVENSISPNVHWRRLSRIIPVFVTDGVKTIYLYFIHYIENTAILRPIYSLSMKLRLLESILFTCVVIYLMLRLA